MNYKGSSQIFQIKFKSEKGKLFDGYTFGTQTSPYPKSQDWVDRIEMIKDSIQKNKETKRNWKTRIESINENENDSLLRQNSELYYKIYILNL